MTDERDEELLREAAKRLRQLERGVDVSLPVDLNVVEDNRIRHELEVYRTELEMQNEELRHANRELESAHSRYFMLFDAAPIPLAVIDQHGRIEDCNVPASTLFGVSRSQVQRQSILSFFDAESRGTFIRHINEVFQAKKRRTCEVTSRPQGKEPARHLRLETSFLDTHVESPTRCLVAVVDLTSQKQLQTRLAEARQEAERSDQLKGQFLSLISHEIRTPLTSIVGYVDLLRRDEPTSEQAERLDLVARASQHLMGILNDILDFSKIEANKLDFHPNAFSTVEFFEYLKMLFAVRAEQKLIALEFDSDTLPPRLIGDKERLRQCVVNVVGNAIKFTPIGGEVSVSAAYRSENMVVTVRDTGPGIPSEAHETIFRPFRQVDSNLTRTHGGTGLGLPITKRLIEMMGGSIYMASVVGEGTTFTLQVPLPSGAREPDYLPKVLFPSQGKRTAPPLKPGERHRLLLAEDDADLQKLMSILLERLGYAFDLAADGVEALECLREVRYSSVLLDMQMPRLDGYGVIRAIREDPGLRHLPIVAVTGQGLKHEVLAAFEAGCDYHLIKPFDLERLRETLSIMMGELDDASSVAAPIEESPPTSIPPPKKSTKSDIASKMSIVIAGFRSRLPARIEKISALVEAAKASEGDAPVEELIKAIHSLRGTSGTYGLPTLYEILTDWELELAQGYVEARQRVFLERLQEATRSALSTS